MKKYVIIVAGGRGNRFESNLPKQFVELAGKPILMHSIEAFYSFLPEIEIIVVLPKDQFQFWGELCKIYQFSISHQLVEGGEERFFSVKNGLTMVKTDSLVAIHDGVRPLIDQITIGNCFDMAEKEGNAIPVVGLIDSVREIQSNGSSRHVDRSKYKLIQTPQVFQASLILNAYEQDYSPYFTDDASVLEAIMPGSIKLVEGNRQNIKITTLEDLFYAEAILRSRKS